MPDPTLHSCVDKVMAQGHDESSAYAICNASLSGSSQYAKFGAGDMSFPPKQKMPEAKQEEAPPAIELSQTEAEDTISFITGVMETGQLPPELADMGQKVLGYFEGKANIEAAE